MRARKKRTWNIRNDTLAFARPRRAVPIVLTGFAVVVSAGSINLYVFFFFSAPFPNDTVYIYVLRIGPDFRLVDGFSKKKDVITLHATQPYTCTTTLTVFKGCQPTGFWSAELVF